MLLWAFGICFRLKIASADNACDWVPRTVSTSIQMYHVTIIMSTKGLLGAFVLSVNMFMEHLPFLGCTAFGIKFSFDDNMKKLIRMVVQECVFVRVCLAVCLFVFALTSFLRTRPLSILVPAWTMSSDLKAFGEKPCENRSFNGVHVLLSAVPV